MVVMRPNTAEDSRRRTVGTLAQSWHSREVAAVAARRSDPIGAFWEDANCGRLVERMEDWVVRAVVVCIELAAKLCERVAERKDAYRLHRVEFSSAAVVCAVGRRE